MPDFNAEIEIDPQEFWDGCSDSEKEELIEIIAEEGHIVRFSNSGEKYGSYIPDDDWHDLISKMSGLRQRITLEEQHIIESIIKKYT
jgi:hypothetical protein